MTKKDLNSLRTVRDFEKTLKAQGFSARQNGGSHKVFSDGKISVSIPNKPGDIAPGTKRDIIKSLDKNHKNLNKIIFFGVGSAIALAIHATFLGIKFDHDLYKLFRRIIMLAFIVFELVAQAYLVSTFYSLKSLILLIQAL